MKKIKNIISGILTVAVFFMAVQVGVAQEKVQPSSDNVEVKESVEVKGSVDAMVLNATVQKLGLELTKPAQGDESIHTPVATKPVIEGIKTEKKAATIPMWFPVDVTGPLPSQQTVSNNPGSTTPTGECNTSATGEICSVRLQYDEDDEEVEDLLLEIQSAVTNNQQITVTIADLITAGASYTSGGPEYAHKAP